MLSGKKAPYCPGCGHNIATKNMIKALEKMEADPLDVIVVSDIGCCGLIDPLLTCHTVHGLHGRACALAMGIAAGLKNQQKKVIAIQGDGGATIGLHHLLEAARLNIDMTLLVLNNMLYGMTGGQASGLSRSKADPAGMDGEGLPPPFALCELAHQAGASYCSRIVGGSDFSDTLLQAFSVEGFSVVEIGGLCPTYGMKKIKEISDLEYEELTLENNRSPYHLKIEKRRSLFESVQEVSARYDSRLQRRLEIIIAGSAGEGIQLAAELLARAGVSAGLKATKKGEYPVTVGSGFSVAEIILCREDIDFSGIESPDIMVIVSENGLKAVERRIHNHAEFIIDRELKLPTGMKGITGDFRKSMGSKSAALSAISIWLQRSQVVPLQALLDAAKESRHADQLVPSIEKTDLVNVCEL